MAERVTFQTADGMERALETVEEAQALYGELVLFGGDWCRTLGEKIRDAATGKGSRLVKLHEAAEAHAVARALDHLRSAAPTLWEDGSEERPRFTKKMAELRDFLRGQLGLVGSMVYTLQSAGLGPEKFISYTGPYDEGERVVTGDGQAWDILKVTQPHGGQEGVMVVSPFKR